MVRLADYPWTPYTRVDGAPATHSDRRRDPSRFARALGGQAWSGDPVAELSLVRHTQVRSGDLALPGTSSGAALDQPGVPERESDLGDLRVHRALGALLDGDAAAQLDPHHGRPRRLEGQARPGALAREQAGE